MSKWRNPCCDVEDNEKAQRGLSLRTIGGLFWTFSGSGLQYVLQLIVLITLARLLTPADFGIVGAALVIISFSAIFSELGIGPAIVQRSDLKQKHIRTGFTVSLAFGALLTLLICGLASAIAVFFAMDDLAPVVRILSFVFVLHGISVVSESLLLRNLRFKELAGIQLTSYVFGYAAVGVILAFHGFGVWSLVWANLAQAASKSLLFLIIQPHARKPLLDRTAFFQLLHFGAGMTMAQIANRFALQGDNLVVGRWLGAEALGFYGRAYQLATIPASLFGQAVDKVVFPALSKVQHEPERLVSAFRRGSGLTALLVLPASAVLFILAPEIVRVLLGSAWVELILPLQVLAVGTFFRTAYKMSASLARAKGAVYQIAWRQGVYAGLIIMGAWVGQFFGLEGVAVGVVIALAIHFALMSHLSLSIVRLDWLDFARLHIPALKLTVFTVLLTMAVSNACRALILPDFAVLCMTGLSILGALGFIVLCVPRALGEDGLWFLGLMLQRMRFDCSTDNRKSCPK